MNTSTNKPNPNPTPAPTPNITPSAAPARDHDAVSAKPNPTPTPAPTSPRVATQADNAGDDAGTATPPTRQMEQSMPGSDELAGKWKQKVGAAKIVWGKLTDDELLKLEGHEQKLAGLVQERYAISRDAAQKQVRTFFEQHMN
jgi:uncharacterized protein YjbJ (UPF0337 family)